MFFSKKKNRNQNNVKNKYLCVPDHTDVSSISVYKENTSIWVNLIKIWTTIIVFRGIS